ncbi:hypothetical protein TGME49_312960 [Toxoplasma gondii ME49]|uniref:Nucleolar protein 16 n=15 Tax=Toxoplasma gondii TaxID=5811 RepID=B9PIG4_TOXGV|nr:hypothetical protein TGME49_312960 [Toxoplasma gondii ME49]EPR60988.1 hypothetical protein TGGT1_312960 [Toxoplasma gondii GT1]ESS35115.1 ribosome biogenesis protein Nop16 [Toxoplasma gondii VEG]KAF4639435.1 hypothetical protein TGRH88_052070 [Toxoplasma gondii]KFG44081.1 ribosome biogenesis protein Nop16 [Toxoplasma gondii GAB2-2007-GAL-DOM2]KFG50178.1 ribosome biogenesis protein Nop16 [Toxoplasma gondii p89]KFG56056.1 ribosome biogenesis protein Nop16 [Toxoplasma gondii FOU]KFG66056.1 r|eukprot:XP_002364508.1 hypothetical protein TGME49_312960 [Toxoplasma gondii ME49]
MKKTRKKTHRAVRRCPKNSRRLYRDLQKQMRDDVLRSKWNNRESIQKNMAKFTLQDFEHRLADDEELLRPSEEKKLNEQQLIIINKLFAKFGDDCEKMSRDTKINVFQWTTGQCRRFLRQYTSKHVCSSAKEHLLPQLTMAPTPAHETLLQQHQAAAEKRKQQVEAHIQDQLRERVGKKIKKQKTDVGASMLSESGKFTEPTMKSKPKSATMAKPQLTQKSKIKSLR